MSNFLKVTAEFTNTSAVLNLTTGGDISRFRPGDVVFGVGILPLRIESVDAVAKTVTINNASTETITRTVVLIAGTVPVRDLLDRVSQFSDSYAVWFSKMDSWLNEFGQISVLGPSGEVLISTLPQILQDASAASQDAVNALALIGNAPTFAAQAESARDLAQTASGEAQSARDIAQTARDESQASAGAASTSETNAAASENAAQDWAEKPEDMEVQTGNYSALHHATKAASALAAIIPMNTAIAGWHSDVSGWHTDISGWQATVGTQHGEVQGWRASISTDLAQFASDKLAFDTAYNQFSLDFPVVNANITNFNTTTLPQILTARDEALQAAAAVGGGMFMAGDWDASAGTAPPAPNDGSAFYKITVAGVINSIDYGVGDSIVYNPASLAWFKIDNTESVTSVNGQQGVVTIDAAPTNHTHTMSDITDLDVAPSVHGHAITDITGLQQQLDDIETFALAGLF